MDRHAQLCCRDLENPSPDLSRSIETLRRATGFVDVDIVVDSIADPKHSSKDATE